jgi:hypothetical protein
MSPHAHALLASQALAAYRGGERRAAGAADCDSRRARCEPISPTGLRGRELEVYGRS